MVFDVMQFTTLLIKLMHFTCFNSLGNKIRPQKRLMEQLTLIEQSGKHDFSLKYTQGVIISASATYLYA